MAQHPASSSSVEPPRVRRVEGLVMPGCGHPLHVRLTTEDRHGRVSEGALLDLVCGTHIPVTNSIPRFTAEGPSVKSFGLQWQRFQRIQLDRFNGTTLSRDRLCHGTGWTPQELQGQRVLEVGCGAGRFTEVLLDAGAEVYAVDSSCAADVCWGNLGPHPRLHVVQATVEALPFARGCFDKVFCYGVLQHTPDPRRTFLSLVQWLKPGGALAVDVYRRSWRPMRWNAKYLWRPLTKRLPPETLLRLVEWYVPRWLPIDNRLARIPVLQQAVASVIPCWNYTGLLALSPEQVREWAVLDTFDALSAWHDHPQWLADVHRWCDEARLEAIDVRYGGNGIVATARKPA